MTTHSHRRALACALAALALAAGVLIAADVIVPQSARAQGGGDAQAVVAPEAGTGGGWCTRIPPGYAHPPVNVTPLTLQLAQPSIEPVPATDGLIHLVYAAQVTNTRPTTAVVASVVPVDPLAGFTATGRNLVTDAQGRNVAGKVKLFAVSPNDTVPADGPETGPSSAFSTSVPAGNAGLMFFDVTYTDPAQVPRLLAHAITLATPDGGGLGTPALTNPVPVGCKQLAVLRPPLVGQGWLADSGCCTIAAYHRDAILPVNGLSQAGQQFAIDYVQLGPNNACCNGPVAALTSWWGYGTPILAAAPGVVVQAVDSFPDQQPVGTITGVTAATAVGNSIVEDIGGGRYVTYAHLKSGSIPAWVREGVRLRPGDLVGRVGNSGNSLAPHLHFQVQDGPSNLDATGLPFVFDVQLLEGSVPEDTTLLLSGAPVPIDRTTVGVRRGLMPARNGVFGYNLPLCRYRLRQTPEKSDCQEDYRLFSQIELAQLASQTRSPASSQLQLLKCHLQKPSQSHANAGT